MSAEILVDTHFILWIAKNAPELKNYRWIDDALRLAVSPLSLLELKYLAERGRMELDMPVLLGNIHKDPRFRIDDISLEELCTAAMDLSWTRDPFDRLLVAHSIVRKIPFGTADRTIRKHYSNVV